jgi:pullulanase/glycogen debranching enzyme
VIGLAEIADQLGETKLIAEAWDAAGLYQLGSFRGRRWSEWNGRFRDDVRSFVRGDRGLVGAIATRLAGSSDLLIDLRKWHRALRRDVLLGAADVQWHGCLVGEPGFSDHSSRVLAFTLAGFEGEDDVHVILNMDDEDLDFELPAVEGRGWRRTFDTALRSPDDGSEPGAEPRVADDRVYRAGGRRPSPPAKIDASLRASCAAGEASVTRFPERAGQLDENPVADGAW